MWPDTFNAKAASPWLSPAPVAAIPRPDFADDATLKEAFGIALARGLDTFNAGVEIFNGDTPKGLWVSINWRNDPIVIAAKDAYLKTLKKLEKPLDKEELLAEVLAAARLAPEDKDKAALFKLYSEIAGFTGKIQVDASTNYTNNTSNLMKITLVGGSDKSKVIDQVPASNIKSKIQNNDANLPRIRLVGGSR